MLMFLLKGALLIKKSYIIFLRNINGQVYWAIGMGSSALCYIIVSLLGKRSIYNMDIDISSTVIKNKALEITTKLTLQDKKDNDEKSFFEIKYATVITIDSSITDKNLIGRIVLCDLQKIIYPKIENIFLNLIKNAGYPEIKFEKKVDFEKLYNDKFN